MARKKVSSKTYKSRTAEGSGRGANPPKKEGVTWRGLRTSSRERASARRSSTVRKATEGPKRSMPRATAKSQSAAARKRRVR